MVVTRIWEQGGLGSYYLTAVPLGEEKKVWRWTVVMVV